MKVYKLAIIFLFGVLLMVACNKGSVGQEALETNMIVSEKKKKQKSKIAQMAQDIAPAPQNPVANQAFPDLNQEKAINMATKATKNLPVYQEYQGRNLEILEVFEGRCVGCWVVNVEFNLQSEKDFKRTDRATVKVSINGWQITDVVYARRSQNIFTKIQCQQIGGRVLKTTDRALCGEEEKIIGEVKDLNEPALCCQPESMAQPTPPEPVSTPTPAQVTEPPINSEL